jgi:hypothetical protein
MEMKAYPGFLSLFVILAGRVDLHLRGTQFPKWYKSG